MSKLLWSDMLGNQYADGSLADGLLRHYLTPPPEPSAPPQPTWEPSDEACKLLTAWCVRIIHDPSRPFLRRLYAQLHRDRVAALESDERACVKVNESFWPHRLALLALADDGNGA